MNGVVHDVQTMLQSTLEAVEQKFLDKIKAGGVAITEEQLEDLRSVFSGPSSNPFQGLETEYKQEAFFKENFNFPVKKSHVYIHCTSGRTAIMDELEYGGDIVKRSTELTPKSSVNRYESSGHQRLPRSPSHKILWGKI